MTKINTLKDYLANVADAIRIKGNTNEKIKASEFDNAIMSLAIGGGASSEFTPEYISWNNQGALIGNTLSLSGLNTSKITNMNHMFNGCENLTSLDVSNFNTNNVKDMASMFAYCCNLTSLDVSDFNTSQVNNMGYMFFNCHNLTSLDLSDFDMNNVKYASYMFSNCYNLVSINKAFLQAGTLVGMFQNCRNLTGSLEISANNLSYLNNAFSWCNNLTSIKFITNNDTEIIEGSYEAFYLCTNLTSIDFGAVDLVFNKPSYTFYSCSNLKKIVANSISVYNSTTFLRGAGNCWDEVPNFSTVYSATGSAREVFPDTFSLNIETINVFNGSSLFSGRYLQSINIGSLITRNNSSNIFSCGNLTTINFGVGDNTNVFFSGNGDKMFTNCYHLTTVNFGNNYANGAFLTNNWGFYNCVNLTTIIGGVKDLSVSHVNLPKSLTEESVMNIVEGLANVSVNEVHIIHYGNRSEMSQENLAIATNKGWTWS